MGFLIFIVFFCFSFVLFSQNHHSEKFIYPYLGAPHRETFDLYVSGINAFDQIQLEVVGEARMWKKSRWGFFFLFLNSLWYHIVYRYPSFFFLLYQFFIGEK